MKNIFFKSLLVLLCGVMSFSLYATDATFAFESASELNNNFTYSCENSNGSIAISTDKTHGGDSSLKSAMGGTSKKSNFLITKEQYQNVTQLSFWMATSDKGKVAVAIECSSSADFSSDVTTILELTVFNSLPGAPSSISNNTFYEFTITPSSAVSGYLRFTFNQPSSSGKIIWMDDLTITYSAGPVISHDASLSALTYDGIEVPSFSSSTKTYNVELPVGTTSVPTIVATANSSAATVNVTQATSLPGTATVLVTAEDGTTTETYSVTFTVASNAPVLLTFAIGSYSGTVDIVLNTVAITVPNGTDVTAITPTLTGKNMQSYTPVGPVDFTNPVTFTLTSSTGETTSYVVTVTIAPSASSDASLTGITYGGTAVPNFSATIYNYTVELPSGTTSAPIVAATKSDNNATVVITQATSATGTAVILVTAEDGITTQTYRVTFSVALPASSLTCHETEIYESSAGYNTPLATYSGREYEVYYVTRDANSKEIIATQPTDKTNGISSAGSSPLSANDGWFSLAYSGVGSESGGPMDEYADYIRRVNMANDAEMQLRIRGYDQFSFLGADNNATESKGKHFEVYVDGVKQSMSLSGSFSVRRFDISPLEHIITVKGVGASNNKFTAFSLRLAYVPKLKHVAGNDSSQIVLQTQSIRPITYYLKNRISDAELTWNGAEATGISLIKGNADTLTIGGNAECPDGTYSYTISARDENGTVVSTITGSFKVSSKVEYVQDADTLISVYEKSAMQPVVIRYYSIDDSALSWQWTGTAPAGLTFTHDADANTLSLSGTPTTVGTFTYTVTLAGANTLTGVVVVESNSPTTVPGATKSMLYLYKSKENKTGGAYSYLITKYNYFARPAGGALLSASEYATYDFIVISEDVDADNEEVIGIISNLQKPVLNMKIFTYTASRLNWGNPDNGSINRTKIAVRQPSHPIFNHLATDSIQVISSVSGTKGLMTAGVDTKGGYCLATSAKRGDEYINDGDEAVFIHEIPAAVRGAKYLTLPIGHKSAANLTADGKTLISNMIDYLCASDAFDFTAPELRITSFSIDGVAATIDESDNTINIVLPEGTNLAAVKPTITLADKTTFVTPASGETVDLSDNHYGLRFTVSDYINTHVYVAFATTADALDDTEDSGLWLAGMTLRNPYSTFVNIYTVTGNLLTTTNNDYDFSALPHGLYLIVTPSGKTIKVVR